MAASDADLEAWATLARAPGLHASHARMLGDPRELLRLSTTQLASFDVPPAASAWLRRPHGDDIARDLAWLAHTGTSLVVAGTPHYPPQLAALDDAPLVLYVRGEVGVLSAPQLAMVGSRNPTAAGQRTARQFAAHFARCGLTITSGLARGIDAASHEGALAGGGRTIAVCGTGLDQMYPRQHRELAERIATHGALVSELPPRTHPLPFHFPQRNRLISGLARGTLVVEAAGRSGSLITAGLAAAQGRAVFAIPGSIHSALSRGCHQLLKQGAKLAENAEDVLEDLKIPLELQRVTAAAESAGSAAGGAQRLDKDYEMLLDALGFEPASVDMLVDRTGLPGESVASMLLILELSGHVEPRAGGTYSRLTQ